MFKLHQLKRPWGVPHLRNAPASGLLINSTAAPRRIDAKNYELTVRNWSVHVILS